MTLVTFSFYLTEKILIFEWLYFFLLLSVFNILSCVRIRMIQSLKTTYQSYSNSEYCGRYANASACTNIRIPAYPLIFLLAPTVCTYAGIRMFVHALAWAYLPQYLELEYVWDVVFKLWIRRNRTQFKILKTDSYKKRYSHSKINIFSLSKKRMSQAL